LRNEKCHEKAVQNWQYGQKASTPVFGNTTFSLPSVEQLLTPLAFNIVVLFLKINEKIEELTNRLKKLLTICLAPILY